MPFGPLEWGFLIAAPFVGSFLALVIIRLPKNEGVFLGRSKCPSCKAPLNPLDLVPVLSWVIVSGKCRHCQARISGVYPLIEMLALALTLWAALQIHGDAFAITVILGWWLLVLGAIDLREFILPDVLTLPLILFGFGTYAYFNPNDFTPSLIGAVVGSSGFYLVSLLYRHIRGREGLGLGDVKLMAGIGAMVGWMGLSTVLLWSVAGALLFVIFKTLQGEKFTKTTPLPFGTFLSAGLWLTWLYGPLVNI